MSKGKRTGALLEMWRPPAGAGDPIGCLATTYTFAPGLFDEQCLARFLDIDSEPNREDFAYLLEREAALGAAYAGVLVDVAHAGVEHSLRWDVLPVRVRGAKQHAKLSLLAWTKHVRILVASANLTEPGYRTNLEVAGAIDLTPKQADPALLGDALGFLRELLGLVSGAGTNPPEVERAQRFLGSVEKLSKGWQAVRSTGPVRRRLAFTLPALGRRGSQSSIEDAMQACRGRGGSPDTVWIASPFFDCDSTAELLTASLCKQMARGAKREAWFGVPAVRDHGPSPVPRLAAPKCLLTTSARYRVDAYVEMLPDLDGDKNDRPWHAKMLGLQADDYSALMIGSSNFTCAGMGVGKHRNAEANLLTIVDRNTYGRETGQLEEVWPEMEVIDDPEKAEWLGARPEEEDEAPVALPVPAGFLGTTYRAGDVRQIVLRLDPLGLPTAWRVETCGAETRLLLDATAWSTSGRPSVVEIAWDRPEPPDKLLVRWEELEAFLPLNVEDSRMLPPPAALDRMSADDMLWILAASDPSAAVRAWAKRQAPPDAFDSDIDSATPVDLDPLRRHDLESTFLHRVRRRARILAQLRANLQRPVSTPQALEWRLRGMIGIEALAERLARELDKGDGGIDEALLVLADFLIVLREVDYRPVDGALPKRDFDAVFRTFLPELAEKLDRLVAVHAGRISSDAGKFWDRVVERCRG